MNTIAFIPKKCAVCGQENEEVPEAIDALPLGPMDLDTRPAETLRSALPYQIQKCSFCGYCNSDISEGIIQDMALLKSKEYLDIINDESLPESVRMFLASAHLLHKTGHMHRSAMESLHAAWVFDDLGDKISSMGARLGVIMSLRAELDKHYDANLATIMLDVLRRAEQYELCKMMAQSMLAAGIEDEFVRDIVEYQIYLSENSDSSCKNVTDAETWAAGNRSKIS